MTLLDIIRQKLLNDSVSDINWPTYIGYAPDDPGSSQIIGLQPSGGLPDGTMAGENVYETFQLKVRSAEREYIIAEAKWRETFNSLHDADLSAGGINLIQAFTTGPMVFYDENNRPCFTSNYRVTRARP